MRMLSSLLASPCYSCCETHPRYSKPPLLELSCYTLTELGDIKYCNCWIRVALLASELIQHFEALVEEHFQRRSHFILLACKAYMDGVTVGCAFECGMTGRETQKSCSTGFKILLAKLFPKLVQGFEDKGIDCSQFIEKKNECVVELVSNHQSTWQTCKDCNFDVYSVIFIYYGFVCFVKICSICWRRMTREGCGGVTVLFKGSLISEYLDYIQTTLKGKYVTYHQHLSHRRALT